ncbi:MAG: hypothetical protein MZW92_46545 [Comamonadaceae bacterium]|nr:hypothetical protein [Comamonadaceae bacterium]
MKLVSTDTEAEEAVVELGGRRETLKLGVVIAAFTGAARDSVDPVCRRQSGLLSRRAARSTARRSRFLGGHRRHQHRHQQRARQAYRHRLHPRPARLWRAPRPGIARMYGVRLDTVKVGEITLRNVDAGGDRRRAAGRAAARHVVPRRARDAARRAHHGAEAPLLRTAADRKRTVRAPWPFHLEVDPRGTGPRPSSPRRPTATPG